MSLMLPPESASAWSIVGVAHDLLAALRGEQGLLPRAESAVLVVVDGLGAIDLRAHAGHARALTAGMGKKDVATSVFPSTTAAALTSILTGVWPGAHGLVGYSVLDRAGDRLVNQLSGWNEAAIDPASWQVAPTVFETGRDEGRPVFAVGVAAYAGSGFSQATLRGADFVPAPSPAQRVALAYDLAHRHPGALVYCYLPEVDKAGHKHGVDSLAWVAALEDVDAALATRIPPGVGVLITSDHGMIDVPAHRQLVLDADDLQGIAHVGGEPRMLHLYLEPDADADAVLAGWRERLEGSADVGSRDEAITSGLFGPEVSSAAAGRIGDILVVARGNRALYDGTAADQRSRGMIGQHGALTAEERLVPLLRRGAFAL
ncbi:alkaline phosphatase family protein [Microbacterium sp.]|uniref:alkaline phosphatase family protein n=1 Tax=Microbacterium sp. TaxID=51671 RepID=UPI0039E4F634